MLRWRSLRELSLINITLSREVSGGPTSWAPLSQLGGLGLTPGWSTKTLPAAWLERKGRRRKKQTDGTPRQMVKQN